MTVTDLVPAIDDPQCSFLEIRPLSKANWTVGYIQPTYLEFEVNAHEHELEYVVQTYTCMCP